MTDHEIKEIVDRVLWDRASAAGFKGADVMSDTDFDGDPIIRVTAHYERRPIARPDPLITAIHDLRSALIERGENRIIFLDNDVASERQIEEDVD